MVLPKVKMYLLVLPWRSFSILLASAFNFRDFFGICFAGPFFLTFLWIPRPPNGQKSCQTSAGPFLSPKFHAFLPLNEKLIILSIVLGV